MGSQPVAILGFQYGRPGTGPQLVQLNTTLGDDLADPPIPGLMRYQVLVHSSQPERICVYWLWRQAADRDAVWASPPRALTGFWARSRPLWAQEPEVDRYFWRPPADRDLCPHGSAVRLTPLPAPPPNAGSTAGTPSDEVCGFPGRWLCGLDGRESLYVEQIPCGIPGESWIPAPQSAVPEGAG